MKGQEVDWRGVQAGLRAQGYVAGDDLAMALHLALMLGRPLLLEGAAGVGKTQVARCLAGLRGTRLIRLQCYEGLEGAAGVGKTQVARSLAGLRGTRLIRLQCYEGLDASHAIYEWNYQRQLLAIRAGGADEDRIFSEKYLLERPLLQALRQSVAPVLLIDEVDRADEEFEAYLLEILSEYQVTVPELGTITAVTKPIVILTSNGTRDLSDALRRRCIYSFVDYPDRATELAILAAHHPGIGAGLAGQIVGFVQTLRREDLQKVPGVAECLDFAAALAGLGINDLSADPVALQAALVTLLKTQADRAVMTTEVAQRIAGKAA